MSMSDVVAALESGEFYFKNITSMNATPFSRVCVNNNHEMSQCKQIKNITSFIQTRSRIHSYLRRRQKRENSKETRQMQQY